jgi:hypothetical protein
VTLLFAALARGNEVLNEVHLLCDRALVAARVTTPAALSRSRNVAILAVALTTLAVCAATLSVDQQQVIQATIAAGRVRFPNSTVPVRVIQIAIVNNYALTTWDFGEGGGQAVLQKKSGSWLVLQFHGSKMDEPILVAFGVPSATAKTLEKSLKPVPGHK